MLPLSEVPFPPPHPELHIIAKWCQYLLANLFVIAAKENLQVLTIKKFFASIEKYLHRKFVGKLLSKWEYRDTLKATQLSAMKFHLKYLRVFQVSQCMLYIQICIYLLIFPYCFSSNK